jgi:hypothetical protein
LNGPSRECLRFIIRRSFSGKPAAAQCRLSPPALPEAAGPVSTTLRRRCRRNAARPESRITAIGRKIGRAATLTCVPLVVLIANWLPDAEAAELRLAFAQEIERLKHRRVARDGQLRRRAAVGVAGRRDAAKPRRRTGSALRTRRPVFAVSQIAARSACGQHVRRCLTCSARPARSPARQASRGRRC